jgi:hypothetical protein
VALVLMAVFLLTDWPREVAALMGAGVLLLSRRFHSSQVMGAVDWELLVLFIGLFVVNHAFAGTGLPALAVAWLGSHGVHLNETGPLFAAGVVLSNLVSNVPAVMLLLPHLSGPEAATTLALVSTFAGNLLLVHQRAQIGREQQADVLRLALCLRQHGRRRLLHQRRQRRRHELQQRLARFDLRQIHHLLGQLAERLHLGLNLV